MNGFDEEQIGRLLRLLPPSPEGGVRAAQELPAARAALDELVARAEQDAAFRLQLRADLERAVAAAGYEPSPLIVSRLRHRLAAGVNAGSAPAETLTRCSPVLPSPHYSRSWQRRARFPARARRLRPRSRGLRQSCRWLRGSRRPAGLTRPGEPPRPRGCARARCRPGAG